MHSLGNRGGIGGGGELYVMVRKNMANPGKEMSRREDVGSLWPFRI